MKTHKAAMNIIFKDLKTGFIYKDVGDKQNYGIFHRDMAEDRQLGWMNKANVNHLLEKTKKE